MGEGLGETEMDRRDIRRDAGDLLKQLGGAVPLLQLKQDQGVCLPCHGVARLEGHVLLEALAGLVRLAAP